MGGEASSDVGAILKISSRMTRRLALRIGRQLAGPVEILVLAIQGGFDAPDVPMPFRFDGVH
jgi:hypothetical protein